MHTGSRAGASDRDQQHRLPTQWSTIGNRTDDSDDDRAGTDELPKDNQADIMGRDDLRRNI